MEGSRMKQANVRTLVDLLRWRAESQGEHTAYIFLPDGETEGEHATFAQLDAQARRIAVGLRRLGLSGERAVLLYPPGPTYVAAFFGCLYAGVVAVPAYPPRNNRGLPRIKSIIEDSGAAIAMTSSGVVSRMRKMFDTLPELAVTELFVSDELEEGLEEEWVPPEIDENSLAFLQYTSGSTGAPKGVMLSHANLLHNSALIQEAFGTSADDVGVIWLPPYHDMGLIGGLLHVVYTGARCVLMPPAAFLQRPMRWLEAISNYRGTVSGGPNFAYELVAKKATQEEIEKLDLSSWKVAFNGAEPVRAETLEFFSEKFKPAGFDPAAHYPVYGLAEATLIVTGGVQGDGAKVVAFDKKGLEQRRAVEASDEATSRELVGCGGALGGQRLAIVDPETGRECGPGEIGEVWVRGPSVAQGYWERPEETERTFGGRIAETGEGPFLRTGDLGFLHGGQLFIAGRIKDLIIIRGVNYYPQDLELTSERSHPALRVGSAAAFAIEVEGEEQLVVAQELEFRQKPDVAEVTAAIREAIVDEHGILPYAVVLVKPGRIPKTSSGKIQRYATRQKYLEGTLETVGEWRADQEPRDEPVPPRGEVRPEEPAEKAPVPARTKAEIEAWLVEQLSKRLKVPAKQINRKEPFARYGLDSVQAIGLAGDLEAWLGRPLSPTLAYDYPNIEALAAYLSGEEASPTEASSEAPLENEPIAVVGLSCRFPGAPNADAFWKLLRDGVDAIREVPADRWDVDELYDPDPDAPGKMITRWGGFIDDVDKFDASFFGISPREATEMDPQQRLLLEVAWEALEAAGVNPEEVRGSRTGVFVGVSSNDYSVIQHGDLENVSAYTGTGNAFSIAANRLSYMLDLRGPSMAIDTACSSSLVTVHLATRSLRAHETDLAIVGGVNLMLSPELTVALSHARMMSPEGRCKTFDASADGYVRGEGVGVVVLKRLSDAVRDNDNILAVIRGSAVNQDGRSNGLTAPNGVAQQEVIRAALADARVQPEDVDYVETHGTGTILGDPIEVKSLAEVMKDRPKEKPCLIGSVKTNIGHLEAAAGIAGLIKVVLSLHHGEIPPHLHFKQINPHIPIDELPFEIPTKRRSWKTNGKPRLAGVSSFGFGGTNAHVVLEEAPKRALPPNDPERPLHVLTASARDPETLRELAGRLGRFAAEREDVALADMAYTLNTGRGHFEQRLALRVRDREQVAQALLDFEAGKVAPDVRVGSVSGSAESRVAFLFTGQGAQYVGMGRELYETQPTFKRALDRCNEILADKLGQPLLSVIFGETDAGALLDETAYTQPALFAIEYGLLELWRSWGVEPEYVTGHSIGEYVAALAAGVFDLEDALTLVYHRGRLMQSLPKDGEMAAVFAELELVKEVLRPYADEVAVAGANGPSNTVISGRKEVVEEVLKRFEAQGVEFRRLRVSHAFHSPLMEPILDEFEQVASEVQYRPPQIGLISNVTGRLFGDGEIPNARYWRQHIRQAVLFHPGMQELANLGCNVFVELGPHPTLIGMARRSLTNLDAVWVASLNRKQKDWEVLTDSLAQLYVRGVGLDWKGFDRDYQRRKVQLPTYPFRRQRYWVESGRSRRTVTAGQATGHPLLGKRQVPPFGTGIFATELDGQKLPVLARFRVGDTAVLPASIYAELALAGTARLLQSGENLELSSLRLPEEIQRFDRGRIELITTVSSLAQDAYQVEFSAREAPDNGGDEWVVVAGATVRKLRARRRNRGELSLKRLKDRLSQRVAGADVYAKLSDTGVNVDGPARLLVELWAGKAEALGKLALPPEIVSETNSYVLHPVVLEALTHVFLLAVGSLTSAPHRVSVIEGLRIVSEIPERLYAFASVSPVNGSFEGMVQVVDETGRTVLEVDRLGAEPLTEQALKTLAAAEKLVEAGPEAAELDRQALLQKTATERREALRGYLRSRLASVLRLAPEQVDVDKPVTTFGLDSIMAIELKASVDRALGVRLPVASLIEGKSISELASELADLLEETASPSSVAVRGEEQATGEFPLSYGQKAMWVQHQVSPDSIFNPVYAVRIPAEIDVARLRDAFAAVVERHQMLRTRFEARAGEPVQIIEPSGRVAFEHEQLPPGDEEALRSRLLEEAHRGFDLEKGPLFRVHLFSRGPKEHTLLLAAHHIVVDLWSLAVITDEVGRLYGAPDGAGILPPLEAQYVDYIRWHRELLGGVEGEKLWLYWQERLAGDIPLLDLPTDFPRPRVQTFNGAVETVGLGRDLTRQLKKLSDEHGVTLFMTLLAAYKVLLHRYTGQEDLVVGTPSTGRTRPEFAGTVGYFVNPVALRSEVTDTARFVDLMQELKHVVAGALEHQDYPIALLVEKLAPNRDAGRTPLFQTMFILQRAHLLYDQGLSSFALGTSGVKMQLGEIPLESVSVEQRIAPFDLTLMTAEVGEELGASLTYNTDLFTRATVRRMLGHYRRLLEAAVENPRWRVGAMPMLTDDEKALVQGWATPRVEKTGGFRPVHELFSERAKTHPDRLAVVSRKGELTYAELDAKANRLARYLEERGVGPEKIVGIALERSVETVVAVLAVLKAGAAYLPLDPSYPSERLRYMLEDAGVDLLITEERLLGRLPAFSGAVVRLDSDWPEIALLPDADLATAVHPRNLAYVIYTSGSTGRPKGVMLEHRGLSNTIDVHRERYEIFDESRVLQFASFSFDASVSEIFTALTSGSTLYVADGDMLLSSRDLLDALRNWRITNVTLPPSVLAVLPQQDLPDLRVVVSAGEACPPDVAERWSKGRKFINAYGPTEATIGVTVFDWDGRSGLANLPIGKPTRGSRIYILSPSLEPVPAMVPGEIYIGGVGVARGYLGRPELTAEKFIPDAFSGEEGARLYRTGDLARFLPDGNIEFIGRVDHQVKVRGFRIELGEVEAAMAAEPEVAEAIALALDDGSGGKRLVGFVVPENGGEVQGPELRARLQKLLPDYMVPASILVLDAFPLTPNGKVDRKALARLAKEQTVLRTEFVDAKSEVEKQIAAIWREVLSLDRVGVNDNFFDLGGHSLALMRVHDRLESTFERQIPVVELFKNPTIRALASFIQGEDSDGALRREREERAKKRRQALAQRRAARARRPAPRRA